MYKSDQTLFCQGQQFLAEIGIKWRAWGHIWKFIPSPMVTKLEIMKSKGKMLTSCQPSRSLRASAGTAQRASDLPYTQQCNPKQNYFLLTLLTSVDLKGCNVAQECTINFVSTIG